MRKSNCILAFLFSVITAFSAVSAAAEPVRTDYVTAELVSETLTIQPGQPFTLALHMEMIEGWHTYWRNPGDSGQATELRWKAPEGVEIGALTWPIPEAVPIGPLVNYGYHGAVLFLIPAQAPEGLSPGETIALEADATWLVCEEICIPESAVLRIEIPISDAAPEHNPDWAPVFDQTRADLPSAFPSEGVFELADDVLTIGLQAAELATELGGGAFDEFYFFPYAEGAIDYAARQTLRYGENGLAIAAVAGFASDAIEEGAFGVLTLHENAGPVRAYEINARAGDVPDSYQTEEFVPVFWLGESETASPASALYGGSGASLGQAADPGLSIPQAILFALIGGLILNLMPCVFPVLFVKAMGFTQRAHHEPGVVRAHGLLFTAGVLASFIALALVLIGLRAGGEQIGWGFQLQSPIVIVSLAYVVFLVGLSLSGVFELGASFMGFGSDLAEKEGGVGAFFTGVLAVVVAAPCTAPFMAAAIGYALLQPAAFSIAVFAALGVGLALPYLLLSFAPGLLRMLPKPGAWMERLKELFAFPMYATVVWLFWVLSRQTNPDVTAVAAIGLVALALAAWLLKAGRGASIGWRIINFLTVVLMLAIAAISAAQTMGLPPALTRAILGDAAELVSEPYSEARLAELRAEGQPVFLDFTAAWCVSCQVNKLTAISVDRTVAAFARNDVVYMVADWTNRDPAITKALEGFGAAGVPVYVYYGPEGAEPQRLPAVLTPEIVISAIEG